MKKKHLLTAISLLLALLLTACGASENAMQKAESYDMVVEETVTEESVEYELMADGAFSTTATEEPEAQAPAAVTPEEAKQYAEKIVYSGNVYIETTDFDGAINALNAAVTKYNGFIQDSSVSGRSNGDKTAVIDRYAYYVVRIPTQHFDTFMSLTNDIGNVTSTGRNAENVTSRYTDYEARLSSLKVQEERLLEMLGTSGDLESLIALEQRLSEVRYEIESIERNLRDLDQRLAYSTVNVDLQEVEVYTPTAQAQRSFGEKLSDAFADGWSGFIRGVQNFAIGMAEALPSLVLLAVIVVAVVLVVRKARKKKKAAKVSSAWPKEAPTQMSEEEPKE